MFDMSGVSNGDVLVMSGLRSSALVWWPLAVDIPWIREDGSLVSDECSYHGSVLFARWIRVLALMARRVVGVDVLCPIEHFLVHYLARMLAVLKRGTYLICKLVGRVDRWVKLMVC